MDRAERKKLNEALKLIHEAVFGQLPTGWRIRLNFTREECWADLLDPLWRSIDVSPEDCVVEEMVEHAKYAAMMD